VTPQHVHTFAGHAASVTSLELDDKHIVSASRDLQIIVWERSSGRSAHIWGHGGRVSSMRLRGQWLMTAFDCVLLRYEVPSGRQLQVYTDRSLLLLDDEPGAVCVSSFDFNEKFLYSAWSHDCVLIHDIATGDVLTRLPVTQPRFVCLSRSLLAYTRKTTKQVHIADLNGTVIDENIMLPGPLVHMSMTDNGKEGVAMIYCKTPNNDLYRVPFVLRPPNGCYRCGLLEEPARPWPSCGKCKAVKYCSADCQRVDWAEHHKKRCRPKNAAGTAAPPPTITSPATPVHPLPASSHVPSLLAVIPSVSGPGPVQATFV